MSFSSPLGCLITTIKGNCLLCCNIENISVSKLSRALISFSPLRFFYASAQVSCFELLERKIVAVRTSTYFVFVIALVSSNVDVQTIRLTAEIVSYALNSRFETFLNDCNKKNEVDSMVLLNSYTVNNEIDYSDESFERNFVTVAELISFQEEYLIGLLSVNYNDFFYPILCNSSFDELCLVKLDQFDQFSFVYSIVKKISRISKCTNLRELILTHASALLEDFEENIRIRESVDALNTMKTVKITSVVENLNVVPISLPVTTQTTVSKSQKSDWKRLKLSLSTFDVYLTPIIFGGSMVLVTVCDKENNFLKPLEFSTCGNELFSPDNSFDERLIQSALKSLRQPTSKLDFHFFRSPNSTKEEIVHAINLMISRNYNFEKINVSIDSYKFPNSLSLFSHSVNFDRETLSRFAISFVSNLANTSVVEPTNIIVSLDLFATLSLLVSLPFNFSQYTPSRNVGSFLKFLLIGSVVSPNDANGKPYSDISDKFVLVPIQPGENNASSVAHLHARKFNKQLQVSNVIVGTGVDKVEEPSICSETEDSKNFVPVPPNSESKNVSFTTQRRAVRRKSFSG